MEMRAFVFAFAAALTASSLWTASAHAAACTNDIDCPGNGCGTQVCDWTQTPMACVPVSASVKGWCTVDTDCKCKAQGAVCNAPYCSFIASDAGAGGSSSGGGSSSR